jgi:anaerobic selenocysteine-containing dehydrogenase
MAQYQSGTQTRRIAALRAAAPEAFVEMERGDAERLGIEEGDLVEVRTRRSSVRVPARLSGIEPGVLFIPFHYGTWDDPEARTAANNLTITGWDPVSKQPFFKFGAAAVKRVGEPRPTARENAVSDVAVQRDAAARGREPVTAGEAKR